MNLPTLYSAMCDEVVRVEEALDDVREMLEHPHEGVNGHGAHDGHGDCVHAATKAGTSVKSDEWKKEFTRIVQDVVQQDAGWK